MSSDDEVRDPTGPAADVVPLLTAADANGNG